MDITLADEVMGIDVAEDIRQAGYSIPIIFMSAHNDTETVHRIKNLNQTDLITKPFLCMDLFEIINPFFPDWSY